VNERVPQPVYVFEGFRVDAQHRVLFGPDGQLIPLTPRLFDALLYFVERAGQLLTKKQLLEAIWPRVVVEEHNLNKTVSELRRALGENPGEHRFFVTKPGHGYRFVANVSITPILEPPAAAGVGFARPQVEAICREPAPEPRSQLSATARYRFSWSRPVSLVAGLIVAVALFAAAAGLGVFDASEPRSNPELRLTLLFEKDGNIGPPDLIGNTVWKPDGRAIAFAARESAPTPQPYVLYLDGSLPEPLTSRFVDGLPKQWTRGGQVLLDRVMGPTPYSQSAGLWAVPAGGGEPEPIFPVPERTTNFISVTADGSSLAALREDEDGTWSVWTGLIAGGALTRYESAPFAPTGIVGLAALSFSPNGRQLLLMWAPVGEGDQAWSLPYPPDPQRAPRRILEKLPSYSGAPQFSWFPDSRHVVVSARERGEPWRLYLADTVSGRFHPLTDRANIAEQFGPVVSPDGTRLVFIEAGANLDLVTMNIHTGAVSRSTATYRGQNVPVSAADGRRFVFATGRGAEAEIWLHERDAGERRLVTARDFPPGTTAFFMAPAVSPDGTRVAYLRVEGDIRGPTGARRLWLSSSSGGVPMRLRDRAGQEDPGSWSPDGAWYVYEEVQGDGTRELKKVRVSGTSEPETLVSNVRSESVPTWSPDGRWILFNDDGLKLVAVDGDATRDLGVTEAMCVFAREPGLLYCIEGSEGASKLVERGFDGTARVVGSFSTEHWPRGPESPEPGVSLTPDGESVTYSLWSPRIQMLLADGLADVALP
jgi:Tol biopolymer transport system component/DNA-binding winged helix-turn-helix (wHTH) protein